MKTLAAICSTATLLTITGLSCAQQSASADIRNMECDLAGLKQNFTDKHPQVQSLKKAIEDQRQVVSVELVQATSHLSELRQRYTDKHPDVQALLGIIKNLELQKNATSCEDPGTSI